MVVDVVENVRTSATDQVVISGRAVADLRGGSAASAGLRTSRPHLTSTWSQPAGASIETPVIAAMAEQWTPPAGLRRGAVHDEVIQLEDGRRVVRRLVMFEDGSGAPLSVLRIVTDLPAPLVGLCWSCGLNAVDCSSFGGCRPGCTHADPIGAVIGQGHAGLVHDAPRLRSGARADQRDPVDLPRHLLRERVRDHAPGGGSASSYSSAEMVTSRTRVCAVNVSDPKVRGRPP